MRASKLDATHGDDADKCAWWPICPEFLEATGDPEPEW